MAKLPTVKTRRKKKELFQISLRLTKEQIDKIDLLANEWCSRQDYIRLLIDKAGTK